MIYKKKMIILIINEKKKNNNNNKYGGLQIKFLQLLFRLNK